MTFDRRLANIPGAVIWG